MPTYPPEVREHAFALYCDGVADKDIAKKVGASFKTIRSWVTKYKWVRRRRELGEKAAKRADEARVENIKTRLLEHDKAGRNLRSATSAALSEDLAKLKKYADARARRKAGEDIDVPSFPELDPLRLQRIGQALARAVYLERQALGLPTDGGKQAEAEMRDLLGERSLDELEDIYRRVQSHLNGEKE